MNKRIVAVCIFFLVFFVTSNVFAEITAEPPLELGAEVVMITPLFDPKDSNNSVGTIEGVRINNYFFYFRLCDVNGNEIKRSEIDPLFPDLWSPCGPIEPMYNDSGGIEKYRYFGVNVLADDNNQFETSYLDLNLVKTAVCQWSPVIEKRISLF